MECSLNLSHERTGTCCLPDCLPDCLPNFMLAALTRVSKVMVVVVAQEGRRVAHRQLPQQPAVAGEQKRRCCTPHIEKSVQALREPAARLRQQTCSSLGVGVSRTVGLRRRHIHAPLLSHVLNVLGQGWAPLQPSVCQLLVCRGRTGNRHGEAGVDQVQPSAQLKRMQTGADRPTSAHAGQQRPAHITFKALRTAGLTVGHGSLVHNRLKGLIHHLALHHELQEAGPSRHKLRSRAQ